MITDATQGTVSSPGYPEAYPDDADCHTLLVAEPGQVITIAFQDFMMEPSNDVHGKPMGVCQFDYVTVSIGYPERKFILKIFQTYLLCWWIATITSLCQISVKWYMFTCICGYWNQTKFPIHKVW